MHSLLCLIPPPLHLTASPAVSGPLPPPPLLPLLPNPQATVPTFPLPSASLLPPFPSSVSVPRSCPPHQENGRLCLCPYLGRGPQPKPAPVVAMQAVRHYCGASWLRAVLSIPDCQSAWCLWVCSKGKWGMQRDRQGSRNYIGGIDGGKRLQRGDGGVQRW